MLICIFLISFSAGSAGETGDLESTAEVAISDSEMSAEEKRYNSIIAILFGLGSALSITTRSILIRKIKSKNYPAFKRAVDAGMILFTLYSIFFVFVAQNFVITLQMIAVGTISGNLTFVARALNVLATD